jgi:outer membrane protein assembly factor BamD
MKATLYIALMVLLLFCSCGEYDKLLKSTDYELKKNKAKEYYETGRYVKSTELLTQILPRYRGSEEAEELNWIYAQGYYGMKDYIMAGSYYKSFVEQFPFGVHAEEASFFGPKCDYLISASPELDQENTNNAIEGFMIFINKYPKSERLAEADSLIKELQNKLVEKSYLSARLYYDMKQYKASIIALDNSLREYSDSKYREEMMFLKLNSLFLYAENSLAYKQKERYQDTLDDYFSFMEEFPKSRFAKEIEDIYNKTNKFLKNDTKVQN